MVQASYFEELYRRADPWGYRTRWYERRKRALLLAMLHRPRYGRGLEIACSIGEATAVLAERCDELLATDANATAVAAARRRNANLPSVRVLCMRHPDDWPQGRFDLVVFAELGYYMTPLELDLTAARIRDCLKDGAMVLACHWRRPIEGCVHTGDRVHARLRRVLKLRRVASHREEDMLVDAWTTDGRSVAAIEGIA